ncbi:MAG: hypothetical protein ACI4EC_07640 [Lachnospiraceae bacterium]
MGLNGTELIEYACKRFEEEKYDEALEAFVLSYSKGIEPDWILENIYNCYVSGNAAEFEQTFKQFQTQAGISYEQCILDFIPYREGEYYIFDKEAGIFRGVFSVLEFENVSVRVLEQMEYSACALEMDWNWNDYQTILTEAKERKIYVVTHDIQRMGSFFKIPELKAYAKNIMVFPGREAFQDFFHQNTSVYLPHAVVGVEEEKNALLEITAEEHRYRLTPEGRNTDNVLLTIGIPTHARGNILLKRLEHLCKTSFDAEIEIAVSKNGTLLYEEEYSQVSMIEDARINYYDHGRGLKAEENWHYTVEMAHGRYVLLIADEDDVCLDALEHYLRLLVDFPEAVFIRAKGGNFYSEISEREVRRAGVEAFRQVFLKQNYLSGMIVRRDVFLEQHFLELKQFMENDYYRRYPHDCWCTLLSLKGDCIREPVQLFVETDSVLEKEWEVYQSMGLLKLDDVLDAETQLPHYARYEERFIQFQGQIEFLHILAGDDLELAEAGLLEIIGKLSWVLGLARDRHYKLETFPDVVDKFVTASMQAKDEFPLSSYSQVMVMGVIKRCAQEMWNGYQRLSALKGPESSHENK